MGPTELLKKTFGSLSGRNFRLYFFGQIISNSGTWMQTIAQSILVLHLTGSGVDLGLVSAFSFLPVLIFGAPAGLIADRLQKRRLLLLTQSLLALQALTLGILTQLGVVRLSMVYALALVMGFVNAIDNPARQSFVEQMVGKEKVQNAVSLNSVVMNAARAIGPGIAAILISFLGVAVCFFTNALSFFAVVGALYLMRPDEFYPYVPVERARGQIRAGLRYVRESKELALTLGAVFLIGTLAFNFQVLLPLLSTETFHGGAGTLGALTSIMGVGAVIGGLISAAVGKTSRRRLGAIATAFGLTILILATMPNLTWALIAIFPMGAASISFIALANSSLQLNSIPQMRGRVMALYTVAFLGTTPIGAPLVGYISQQFGPRAALVVGAASALVAGPILLLSTRKSRVVVEEFL